MMFAHRWVKASAIVILIGGPAWATTLHVDGDAAAGGDGLAWSSAFRHLSDALAAAALDPAVTEVRVGGGVYRPDQSESGHSAPGDREAHFALLNGVAIRGGFRGLGAGGSPDDQEPAQFITTLSGDLLGDDEPAWVNSGENTFHVVRATGVGATARLEGVTITGGNAWQSTGDHASGAGVRIAGASPTLDRCRIMGNFSHLGAGVVINGGSPAFNGCRFEGNWAWLGRGGALYAASGSSLDARNCVFADNFSYGASSVGDGGAVFLEFTAPATFVQCDFWSNESRATQPVYSNGGAVCALADGLSFVSCRFGRNTAAAGGAVWAGGDTTFVNCEFNANHAQVGGAISAFTANTTIANTTFVGNSAGDGGALDNNLASVATISNSIFWDSQSNGVTGLKKAIHNVDGSDTIVRYTCIEGLFDVEPGEDPIDPANYPGCTEADPLFTDSNGADNSLGDADDDTSLAGGSPVVDAGRNSYVPDDFADIDRDGNTSERTPLDLRGLARLADDRATPDTGHGTAPIVDMGAYERAVGGGCPADIDGDGAVGFSDLNLLLGKFNQSGAPGALVGDLDGDGDVDFADLNALLSVYNTNC